VQRADVLRTLELLFIIKKEEEIDKRRKTKPSFVLKPDEENPSIRKPDLEKAKLSRYQKRQIRKAIPKLGLNIEQNKS